ncbi:MAG: DegQ family serine endoprotease [Acidobacteria bacterium]|nr:DegQ family serine endoprotease [Acidobacteriota bacterium]
MSALAAVLIAGGVLTRSSSKAATILPETAPAVRAVLDPATFQAGFSALVKQTSPAVVNIYSTRVDKQRPQASPFQNDPFFRRFFGDNPEEGSQRPPRERRQQSLGSGVVVNSDGYIVTNNHVVDGATEIKVTTHNKKDYAAKVVGRDPKTDLAVLKVEAKDLPYLRLGDSSKAEVGDIVLAIGNPFGLNQTVTMGIISAKGRGNLGIEDYEDFIQTDAAINPGNSGGALVNTRGELIGINTAMLSGSGGSQGVGFAIPVNMARNIVQQIEKNGRVVRGYLGVSIQPVSEQMAKAFGRTGESYGALVAQVSPDSPAEKAGLQPGDIILELNDNRVEDSRTLSLSVSQMSPGSPAHLKVFRNGASKDFVVTLGELPEKGSESAEKGDGSNDLMGGVNVQNLTPDIARELNVPGNTAGVVVTRVDPSSAASEAGLRQGDIVREVNRKPVANAREFESAVRAANKGAVLLLVNRNSQNLFLVVQQQ